jgi:Coenzyme PQQ synthesis protein D (PqqD)
MLPCRREADLLVRTLSDETLIYDLKCDRAHCLNRTAAAIWQHCDGRTSVAQLVATLRRDARIVVDEHVVWMALRQLHKARLLQGAVRPPDDLPRLSRRALIRKVGAAAAVPVVMTILAPEARAQASDQCTGTSAPCSAATPCPGALRCADRGGMMCSCG